VPFTWFSQILDRPGFIPSGLERFAQYDWISMVVRQEETTYFKWRNHGCLRIHNIVYRVMTNPQPNNQEGVFLLKKVLDRQRDDPLNTLSGRVFETYVVENVATIPFVNEPPAITWVRLTKPLDPEGNEFNNIRWYSVFNGIQEFPFTPAQLFNEDFVLPPRRDINDDPNQH
jgi:hypothetical protein